MTSYGSASSLEDFVEFRKAGLTHPIMAEIEKELGVDSSMILTKPQQKKG
jgi:hypothetical protein